MIISSDHNYSNLRKQHNFKRRNVDAFVLNIDLTFVLTMVGRGCGLPLSFRNDGSTNKLQVTIADTGLPKY